MCIRDSTRSDNSISVVFRLNGNNEIEVLEDIYADNLIKSVDSVETTQRLFQNAIAVFQQAGMNIRGWNSNKKLFHDQIPDNLPEDKTETTVLGVQWNCDSDKLPLVSPAPQPLKNTMQEVLKLHAKLYDPLGWVIPVAIRAKMLLQRCHIKKYTWYTQLDEEETKV